MERSTGYTGRIHFRTVKTYPWIQRQRWEHASLVMNQKVTDSAAQMFQRQLTPLVQEYARHLHTSDAAAQNGNLQLQEQICHIIRSYIVYFIHDGIVIPEAVYELLLLVIQMPDVMSALDSRVVERIYTLFGDPAPQPES